MATDAGVLQTVEPATLVTLTSRTKQPISMKDANTIKRLIGQPWFRDGLNVDSEGSIVVTVKVEGVIQANVLVKCIHRQTSIVVNNGRTDANGQITFSDLNRDAIGEYYVIAFSADDYNALIYDKLTPV